MGDLLVGLRKFFKNIIRQYESRKRISMFLCLIGQPFYAAEADDWCSVSGNSYKNILQLSSPTAVRGKVASGAEFFSCR